MSTLLTLVLVPCVFIHALTGPDRGSIEHHGLMRAEKTIQADESGDSASTGSADFVEHVPGSDGTYSQNYQDQWLAAIARHNGWDKSGGFFMDLGAFNGLKCSNTALIEKSFGWKGICVEANPVPGAFSERSCVLVTRALSGVSDQEVKFYGTPGSQTEHIGKPGADSNGPYKVVKTISLLDLVHCVNSTDASPELTNVACHGISKNAKVPSFINAISLDIEGQGLNLLKTFPFEHIKVGAWVIEKETEPQQDKQAIDILLKHGYMLAPVENSGVDNYFIQPQFWDPSLAKKDWRVHPKGTDC